MDKVGQDIRQYSAAWYDKMVQIWQDRLLSMGVRDTGALLSSVHGAGNSLTEAGGTISFQFLQYTLSGIINRFLHGSFHFIQYLIVSIRKLIQ